MKKLFLLLVAMLAVLATGGCRLVDFHEFSISGRVVDAYGKPISGVTVKVSEDNTEAVTAANGTFTFSKMALGMKTLTCSHTAYWTQKEYVEVRYLYNVQVADIVMLRKRDPVLDVLAESMVLVEGGTFQMGATSEQGSNAEANEKPVHSVTLSDFYIGKYEVTQGLWKAVMGSNPSYCAGDDNLPVERVSWQDVQNFIKKLNQLTDRTYRLPTEAEWEYAARGGNQSQGYKYAGGNSIDKVAWYRGNSANKTHPVGQKQPNELGLYDMSGNVWEWCQDWYGSYESSAQTNPTGPTLGSDRVLRGGSYVSDADCRVSSRNYNNPSVRRDYYGFRLVLLP